jgi:hypothetical protein
MALRVFWGALGTIERLEPALDALFAQDAVIEKRAQGLGWPEGPLWMPGLPPRCLLKLERNKPSSCWMVNCRSW